MSSRGGDGACSGWSLNSGLRTLIVRRLRRLIQVAERQVRGSIAIVAYHLLTFCIVAGERLAYF